MTVDAFRKVVRLGTIPHGKARISVYCKVEWSGGDRGRLSITGVEGPRRCGDCSGSVGQINMGYETAEARDEIRLAPGWDRPMLDQFFATWDRYHLNDAQAGSPAQMAYLRARESEWQRRKQEGGAPDRYGWAKEVLARAGLDPDVDHLVYVDHPNGDVEERAYRYGSAWYEPVPEDVLKWLYLLPETDQTPAWV